MGVLPAGVTARWVFLASLVMGFCVSALLAETRSVEVDRLLEKQQATEARLDALLKSALENGRVSYHETAAAGYGEKGLSDAVLKEKREWRLAMEKRGFVFRCDYDAWNDGAAIRNLGTPKRREAASELLADYDARRHQIRLSRSASSSVLIHEAGHSLQRMAIRADGSQGKAGFSNVSKLSDNALKRSSQRLVEQYRYLASQDELEVRLQDLNRAYSLVGSPIMNEADTLRALALIGFPLSFEEVQSAYRYAGLEICKERFDTELLRANPFDASLACFYSDARELLVLRRLALKIDPDGWPRLLSKILFESPGHF